MSKLSLLSVEVSQSTDIKGSATNKSSDNKNVKSAFSDVIEKHNQEQKTESATKKTIHSGNDAVKAANTVDDNPAELIEEVKGKSDAEKVQGDEEHTLPVPIIYETESAEKAAEVLSIVTSSADDKQSLEAAKTAINTDAKHLLVDENKSANNKTADASGDDEAVDLLKMLGAVEKLITTKTPTEEGKQNIHATNYTESEKQKSGVEKALKEETIINLDSVSQKVLAQKQNSSNDEETKHAVTKQFEQVVKNNVLENEIAAKAKPLDDLAKVDLLAGTKAEQKALAQVAVDSTGRENSSDEILSQNKDLAAEFASGTEDVATETKTNLATQSSVNPLSSSAAKVDDKTASEVTNQTNTQSASQIQANQASLENEQQSDTLQARAINQSTVSSPTSVTKEQVQQAVVVEENVPDADEKENSDKITEEVNLAKAADEKASQLPDKVASMVNQTLETQAGRPTVSAAELAAHQEQSFENVMSKLSSSTTQTQKAIAALNTETIAIYRKDFANAVKDKVMVMINQKIQQVEIQLDPPEMGNVHVRVNLQNEQAAVQFIVQNPQAKDALEQNMGKLREMLAENGVDVGDANIEQRQPGEQSQFGENGASGQSNGNSEPEFHENHQQVANMVKASSTGVDYYA